MLVWPQAENGSKNVFKKGERHVKLIQWCSKEEKKKTVGKDSKCQANISWVALQQNSRADSALYDSCALDWQIKAISPLPFVAGTGNF